jgi:high-affinity Fe2+/Pb2+ permease
LINALAGMGVLAAGLVLTGNDGKMATYGALVLVCATVEWLMQMRFRQPG